MLNFNIDLNPNNIDFNDYDLDSIAAQHMAFTADIPMAEQNGYPEDMDLPVGSIKEIAIKGTGYPTSSARLYYPEGNGPFPVLFFIHGGAFFGGWQFLDEPLCRFICRNSKTVVISPTYVLAPEFPHPYALIELYKELLYLRENAVALDIDMERIAIGGGSAGAHHALSICQIAAERRDIDNLKFSYGLFFYPVLDLLTKAAEVVDEQSNLETIPPEVITIMNNTYAEGLDRSDPLISPLFMDLDTLPPCAFFTGRTDSLNPQLRRFLHNCLEAGKTDVLIRQYPGVAHGFCESDISVESARDAKRISCLMLKQYLIKK